VGDPGGRSSGLGLKPKATTGIRRKQRRSYDFVPDLAIPGLGSLDDLVLALLALRLLLDLAPPAERPPSRSGEVIDATYRVLEE